MMMPFNTTTPTSWIVEVYPFNEVLLQNVSVNDPSSNSTVLTSLSPGIIYKIRVAGINTRGIGNFSEISTAQTFRGIAICSLYTLFYSTKC